MIMMVRNNGNGKLSNSRYFGIRILMTDILSYNKVVSYLENIAIKTVIDERDISEIKTNYILDKDERQIARTRSSKRVIELTREVKPEIRSKIETIIAGY